MLGNTCVRVSYVSHSGKVLLSNGDRDYFWGWVFFYSDLALGSFFQSRREFHLYVIDIFISCCMLLLSNYIVLINKQNEKCKAKQLHGIFIILSQ